MRLSDDVRRRAGRAVLALLAIAASLALAACGSSGGTSGGSGGKDTQSLATLRGELAAAYAGATYKAPPTSSPAPARGKSVWVISCGQEIPDCAIASSATMAAARAMGWSAHLYDAGQNVDYGGGVRQAIAAGANGILTYAADCSDFKEPLVEAKRAGVPVVSAEALDCNQKRPTGQTVPGQQPLFAWTVSYAVGSFPQFVARFGGAAALEAIDKTDGKAKVVYLTTPVAATIEATRLGFQQQLDRCAGCKTVDVVKLNLSDVGPPLQAKIQQALLQHPEANVLAAPADYFWTLGAAQAVRASGRANNIIGIGAEGLAPNMDLVRAGGPPQAGTGLALGWEGWSEIDALNRIFNKQRPVSSGIGIEAYDKQHNMPPSGPWKPPVDYQAAYLKAWGVAK